MNKIAWEKYQKSTKEVFDFAEGYRVFLGRAKNERNVIKESVKLLKKDGYKDLDSLTSLKGVTKVYAVNKGKSLFAIHLGKNFMDGGLNILGAHIDSPRLDLKPVPLYEKGQFALLDTHYYGGVKKYQWTTIPLSLVGLIVKKDGTKVDVNLGEDEGDPVLGIGDLLIHLSADQMGKPLARAIEGEKLDVTIGSIPAKGKVKDNVLSILKKKYNIEEDDFLSAEIEVVPNMKPCNYGIDNSMIAGYGHDDRCCAYPSLIALLDEEKISKSGVVILTDKEEVGSHGATGAFSKFFEYSLIKLMKLKGIKEPNAYLAEVLSNSNMLSSDVSAGSDPLYSSVDSPNGNQARIGYGLTINKYTGSRGKSSSNDANAEFLAKVRNIFDSNDVSWQISELGAVDAGGGGTIAFILAEYNINVIDAGIAVLNMHAPMEVISKVDLFEAYKGYKAFLKDA